VVVSGCHCGGACICVDCTPTMTITLTPPAHAPRPPAQHPARARTRAQIFRAPAVPPPVCHNGLILVATDPERPPNLQAACKFCVKFGDQRLT
jgi:hypothetical protein